ncbi:MAG: hypothetical protein U0641_10980 [Anaerolineae bacterium]
MTERIAHAVRRKSRANRTPVRRFNASRHMLLVLIAFAATVIVTRLYLELSGYPQIGGGGPIHIAHVLWGGLILFVAAVLPLMLANQWALTVSSILAGIGMGLFIDEVGKFITSSTDYFVPIAAPIIYGVFLVTVWVYLQTRRPPPASARNELYRVLDEMKEVLDHDLDPDERRDLLNSLQRVQTDSSDPNVAKLAREMLDFLNAEGLQVVSRDSNAVEVELESARLFVREYVGLGPLRVILIIGFLALGVIQLTHYSALSYVYSSNGPDFQWVIHNGTTEYLVTNPAWIVFRATGAIAVGLLYLVAAVFLMRNQVRAGARSGMVALLLSLTVLNLISFYFQLFFTIAVSLVELFLLLVLVLYRRRALTD